MASTTQTGEKKKQPSPLRSIIAGSTAGAIEIGMLTRHDSEDVANQAVI